LEASDAKAEAPRRATTAARPISSKASTAACACWRCSAAAAADDAERLAKAADLPRATARRILFTLERAGFVASDGKLFRLTPRVLVLASAISLQPCRLGAAARARPAVERGAGNLVDGDPRRQRRRLHRPRQPDADIFRGIDIGYRLPAFCTSVGRVCCRGCRRRTGEALEAMDSRPLTPSP
jgi:IclR family pca regulon transcriptional regulator